MNKAAGTLAITGDLEINGGIVKTLADNQIASTSNLTINQGSYDGFGKNQTFASVTMAGGNFRTSSPGTGGSTITVTGDFNATGLDDLTGSVDGVAANSNTTLSINGTLRLNGYSRGTVGGTASSMILGGLEMTGTTLLESGGGSMIRLNGDLTTLASSNTARLGSTTVAGAQVQLTGTRTFNVADGSAGIDLSASTALTDGTLTGNLVKSGAGTLQLEGATLANAYSGTTSVNEGAVVLFKTVGTNAIPAGALTIGDGVGGAKADKVVLRLSNQIADANNVTIASSGVLDLETFNASETIASLAGAGAVDVGPGSALAVSGATNTVFSGSIQGGGSLTKGGSSTLELSGTSDILGGTTINGTGKLIVSGSLGGSVTVNTGTTLAGTGIITGPVTVNAGGTVAPGNSPGVLSTGSFSLVGTSTLSLELGGSTVIAGTDYDQLSVIGSVDLGATSTLAVSILGGFNPAFNDAFIIVLNDGIDAVNGGFAGIVDGDTVSFGGYDFTFDSTFDGNGDTNLNDVALISQIPEPSSFASLIAGLGSLVGLQRFRRRRSA